MARRVSQGRMTGSSVSFCSVSFCGGASHLPLTQVASLITELVTNDYVTGETFTIDGGLTMRIA
jgi:hypothetical protein